MPMASTVQWLPRKDVLAQVLVLATQMVTLNVGCWHRQVNALALLEEHENRSGFPFRAPERDSLAFWLRACIRRIGLLCPAAIPVEGLDFGGNYGG
jgi:hypothetical protein